MLNFHLTYTPKMIIFNSENDSGSEMPDKLSCKWQRFLNVSLIPSLCSHYTRQTFISGQKKELISPNKPPQANMSLPPSPTSHSHVLLLSVTQCLQSLLFLLPSQSSYSLTSFYQARGVCRADPTENCYSLLWSQQVTLTLLEK